MKLRAEVGAELETVEAEWLEESEALEGWRKIASAAVRKFRAWHRPGISPLDRHRGGR